MNDTFAYANVLYRKIMQISCETLSILYNANSVHNKTDYTITIVLAMSLDVEFSQHDISKFAGMSSLKSQLPERTHTIFKSIQSSSMNLKVSFIKFSIHPSILFSEKKLDHNFFSRTSFE